MVSPECCSWLCAKIRTKDDGSDTIPDGIFKILKILKPSEFNYDLMIHLFCIQVFFTIAEYVSQLDKAT